MDLFAHIIEMHSLTSWYEEDELAPVYPMETENLISDLALADTPKESFIISTSIPSSAISVIDRNINSGANIS